MSALDRDGGRHLSAQDEDGAGLVVAVAIAAPVGALLWAGIVQVWAWVAAAPPETLVRLGALLVLLAGSGLVFGALVELERQSGRRPTRAVPREAQPVVPPSRRDALSPRVAGPRALRVVRR